METVCGECNKEYSKDCEIKLPCRIHNKTCFQCVQCKPKDFESQDDDDENVEICFSCEEQCRTEEVYFDVNCSKFICKNQFKNFDFSKKEGALPCGCLQSKQHVIAFMSSFCFACLRKLSKPEPNQIRLCTLCFKKNEEHEITKVQKGQAKKQQTALQIWLQRSAKKQSLQKFQNIESQIDKNSEKLIIQLLNQDFKKTQQQLRVSEFTRVQIKKSLLNDERDKQCPICNIPYSLQHKPMMICMQQHLICEKCFQKQASLKNCPLCSQQIQKDKVRVSRQRMRTLELQTVMLQKFGSKHKRYMEFCHNDIQKLKYRFEIQDAEIQTENYIEKPKDSTEKQQQQEIKKRGRPLKAELGEKKQKKESFT